MTDIVTLPFSALRTSIAMQKTRFDLAQIADISGQRRDGERRRSGHNWRPEPIGPEIERDQSALPPIGRTCRMMKAPTVAPRLPARVDRPNRNAENEAPPHDEKPR